MEIEGKNAYKKRISLMDREHLEKEAVKLHGKLNKISKFCDVKEAIHSINTQSKTEKKLIELNKENGYASEWMKDELRRRGIDFPPFASLRTLTDILRVSDAEKD